MHASVLDEPELEFGGGQTHEDPRTGIASYGPFDAGMDSAPERIRIGIVGPQSAAEGIHAWLTRAREPIAAKKAKTYKQEAMFPPFPGFDDEHTFRSVLVFDDKMTRQIPRRVIDRIRSQTAEAAVRTAVEAYMEQIRWLAENGRCDVIICHRPEELDLHQPAAIDNFDDDDGIDDDPNVDDIRPVKPDFHDQLKAAALGIDAPLQIIRPESWDDPTRPPRGLKRRRVQDPATRAWNLHAALYYKAHGIPWRLTRSYSDLATCYLGVSFYNSADRKLLHTSVAQLFNERGEGIIVRGGPAAVLKDDRRPHLSESDAAGLVTDALTQYRQHHGNFPARLVIHKTSQFTGEERAGFTGAASALHVELVELLWLPGNEPTRLFRHGEHPPLRGTLVSLAGDRHLLYTKGSVEFYGTYRGMYIPDPLCIRTVATEHSPEMIATEMLALTKLNWNHTDLDGRPPITLQAAEKVKFILRHVDPADTLAHRYAHYM